MSRRERFKTRFGEFKTDVKKLLVREARGASRPNVSSSNLPQACADTEGGENSNPRASVPRILSTTLDLSHSDRNPDHGAYANQSSRPGGPIQEGGSDVRGSSQNVACTGEQASKPNATGATNEPISGSKVNERTDAVASARTGFERSDVQSAQESSTQAAQANSNASSSKSKGPKELARVLEPVTNMFGPIKEIVDMFVGCVDIYQVAGAARVEYDELQMQVESLLGDLVRYFNKGSQPLTMTKSIESICRSIKSELEKIQIELGRNVGVRIRYLEASDETNAILSHYRRIESHLQRLMLNVNMEMWKDVEEQVAESRVDRLPCASPAWYDSAEGIELDRRACTKGTRVGVLVNILNWACGTGEAAVYWLNGMAGTGKTTIAYSVCAELDARHHLGASFFCSRLREECRNVNMIIPSIAYQLARFSRPFKSALSKVLEKDPDIHGRLPHMQFDALIAKPILEAQDTLPEGLTVVIDALDECDHKETTSRMLDVLLSRSANLPIRFIVSSRPETQIRDQMTDERAKSRLVLHELDKSEVQLDVEKYLREELAPMKPSDEDIAQLVARAGILFIYASTAVRHIGYDNFRRNPGSRLRNILDSTPVTVATKTEEIDQLYAIVLGAALGDRRMDECERDDMLQVLHTVVCAREPLATRALSELLQINVDRVRAALRPMWSVLHVVGGSEVVMTLHASFPDFMFDSTRSKAYWCDSNAHHHKLAEHCLDYIAKSQPQFNVYGLESSYLPDESVPDIHNRVTIAVSPGLFYACRYWTDHVKTGNCALGVIGRLRDFLSTRLLLWMEVLNLKHQMNTGTECASLIAEWCMGFEGERELAELARDAQRFVEAFASNPVSQSTPHIYVSMLAFWPRSGPLFKHYVKFTRGPVKAEGMGLDRRQLAHVSIWAFEKAIRTIAVSPNGRHIGVEIASDLLVVESSSGRVILGPLQGLQNKVKAIQFSSDGIRILAGSVHRKDATIVGWDTRSGDAVLGPLQLHEHTDNVNCLSFSPDCSRIATGCSDKTVRLWDAQTGEKLLQLETQGWVMTVVFSPDGTRFAAGSGRTLQVWDSQRGDTVLGPVTDVGLAAIRLIALSPDNSRVICAHTHNKTIIIAEHPDDISCIAYSPDGRYVVSAAGSVDRTIRIWDPESGSMVLGPLEAHTRIVNSIALSPDGSRVISACEDGLVCTWDTLQRSPTSSSISTFSNRITSVKFSSDGTRFISGSKEGTICIWDVDTGEMVIGPVKVHIGEIAAVDFRNDRVVSASLDGKICICDARSGEVALGPVEIGSEPIRAIAYSPDGKLVATGSGATVDAWDAQDGSRVLGPLTDLHARVWSVQFSPDNTRIVASSLTSALNVAVWDISDERIVLGPLRGHKSQVHSVSYSPNGALIASGSEDNTIIIWDAYTGKKEKEINPVTGHSSNSPVYSVSFSPDSTRLASCCQSFDQPIRIWDVQTGATLFETPTLPVTNIQSVQYSPDGTRFLARSYGMRAQIYDARSPAERVQLCSGFEVDDWTINKDGWVVDDQSRLLVWVPGDLRNVLLPSTLLAMTTQDYVRLKFDKSRMGESWVEGYAPHI